MIQAIYVVPQIPVFVVVLRIRWSWLLLTYCLESKPRKMKKPRLESSIDIVLVVCTYNRQLAVCLFLLWLGTANPEQFLSSLPKMFHKIWNFNVRQTAKISKQRAILCKMQLKLFVTMKKEVLLRLVFSGDLGWNTKMPFSFFAKIVQACPFFGNPQKVLIFAKIA
jgi:hypothetical protein